MILQAKEQVAMIEKKLGEQEKHYAVMLNRWEAMFKSEGKLQDKLTEER